MDISAVILASGKGRRMKIESKKQFINLNGVPVFMYSVNKFLTIPEIKEVILVINEEDRKAIEKLLPRGKVPCVKLLKHHHSAHGHLQLDGQLMQGAISIGGNDL